MTNDTPTSVMLTSANMELLLFGHATDEVLNALETQGVILGDGGFVVAITQPRGGASSIEELFQLRELIVSAASGKFVSYSFIIRATVATVFCLFRDEPSYDNNLQRSRQVTLFFRSLGDIQPNFVCGISPMAHGISCLPGLFSEAMEAVACFSFFTDLDTCVLTAIFQREGTEELRWKDDCKATVHRFRRDLSDGDQNKCLKNLCASLNKLIHTPPAAMGSISNRLTYLQEILNAALTYEDGLDGDELRSRGIIFTAFHLTTEAALYASAAEYTDMVFALKRHVSMPWDERLNQVVNYVNQNLTDQSLSLTSVAAEFSLNDSTLANHFKSKYGEGLWQYVQRQRVSMAKELLQTTANSIFDISRQAGFGSMVSMHRAFKKYENAAPGSFRTGD